jgi:hypothetical protein
MGTAYLVRYMPGPSGPSGGTAPSGTGFVHITAGSQDAAARAVILNTADVTNVLQIANGGTGLSAIGANNTVLTSNGAAMVWAAALSSTVIPNPAGDVTGTFAATTVVSITGTGGVLPLAATAASIQIASGGAAPGLSQAATNAANATGATLTIQAQNSNGTGNCTGGTIVLQPGSTVTAGVGQPGGLQIVFPTPSGTGTNAQFAILQGLNSFLQAQVNASNTQAQIVFANPLLNASIFCSTNSVNSGQGVNLTVSAGNESGTTSTGGNLLLVSGTGTSAHGVIQLQVGGTTEFTLGPNGLALGVASSVAINTSGSTTLTQAQYKNPIIQIATVTLTGNATIVFPNVAGRWEVDVSNVNLGGHTLAMQSGASSSAGLSPTASTQIVEVVTYGGATISVSL